MGQHSTYAERNAKLASPLRRQWPGHAAQTQGRACKSQAKTVNVQNLFFSIEAAADDAPAQERVVSQATVLGSASPATAVARTCTVPAERAEAGLACVSPRPFSHRRLGPGRQRRVGAVREHSAGVGLARVSGGKDLQRGRERLAVPWRKRNALRRRGRAAAGADGGVRLQRRTRRGRARLRDCEAQLLMLEVLTCRILVTAYPEEEFYKCARSRRFCPEHLAAKHSGCIRKRSLAGRRARVWWGVRQGDSRGCNTFSIVMPCSQR